MNQTIILIALFTSHFLADFTHLSTAKMLEAKRFGTPLFPIFQHALVHSLFVFIVLLFTNLSWEIVFDLTFFQLSTHFLIDIWKGKMNKWFPVVQSPANKLHWVLFGFDQLLHAIVLIIISHYSI